MQIQINGEKRDFATEITVTKMLQELKIRPGRVVVELNRDILSRDAYEDTHLKEGDAIEIVHFVGGG